MHIVMLSDLESEGGAAVAASRLAEALYKAGHQVTRVVHWADGQEHVWQTYVLRPSVPFYRRALRFALRVVKDPFSERRLCDYFDRLLANWHIDVFNVHNLHKAADFGWSVELVRICARYAPTVWTLHDMWSFTGRCAYSYECRKFVDGCDASCPTPMEYPALEPRRIPAAWEVRRHLLAEHKDLVAVCPSRWLAKQAAEGGWGGHRIEVIPYGLPLDVYRPINRSIARAELGISSDGPVLLAAAHNMTATRKGGAILVEALKRLRIRPLTLVTLGSGDLPLEAEGVRWHPLGYVDDERRKGLAYNAADLLVHAAPVDNLPNVVMEALACGTPCAGFEIGGVPDMVRPGLTGWLAQDVSPEALANVIDDAVAAIGQGMGLRASCRAIAEAEYADTLQAQRYLHLFRHSCINER